MNTNVNDMPLEIFADYSTEVTGLEWSVEMFGSAMVAPYSAAFLPAIALATTQIVDMEYCSGDGYYTANGHGPQMYSSEIRVRQSHGTPILGGRYGLSLLFDTMRLQKCRHRY